MIKNIKKFLKKVLTHFRTSQDIKKEAVKIDSFFHILTNNY